MNIQTSMTDDTKERIVAMQEELFALLSSIPLAGTEKQVRGMRKAYEWLTDVTQPLNYAEKQLWAGMSDSFCAEARRNQSTSDYEFDMNDYWRREALEYMAEQLDDVPASGA